MESFYKKDIKRILTAGLVLIILLSVFILFLSINELKESRYVGSENYGMYTITVNGEGEAFAVPDTASFNFRVEEEAESVSVAQESVTNTVNNVLSFLEEEGIKDEDIKTTGYNIQPRYEYIREAVICTSGYCPPSEGQRVLAGYVVSHNIEVKLDESEEAGKFVSEVGNMGVDYVSGVSFVVEDESAVEEEARASAIKDAKEKAGVLAQQLGVSLGDVITFSETGGPTPYYAYEGLGGAFDEAVESRASVPNIPAGENKVVSRVAVTFKIK